MAIAAKDSTRVFHSAAIVTHQTAQCANRAACAGFALL